jgi:hypothetical protein
LLPSLIFAVSNLQLQLMQLQQQQQQQQQAGQLFSGHNSQLRSLLMGGGLNSSAASSLLAGGGFHQAEDSFGGAPPTSATVDPAAERLAALAGRTGFLGLGGVNNALGGSSSSGSGGSGSFPSAVAAGGNTVAGLNSSSGLNVDVANGALADALANTTGLAGSSLFHQSPSSPTSVDNRDSSMSGVSDALSLLARAVGDSNNLNQDYGEHAGNNGNY